MSRRADKADTGVELTPVVAFEASLADTGNALAMTRDGDGKLTLSLPPESHTLVSAKIRDLMDTTFYVSLTVRKAPKA